MVKKLVLMSALVLLLSPAAARADWLLTPQVGGTFGNGGGAFSYGASIGWMGDRKYGVEAEFAFVPSVFDNDITDLGRNFDLDLIDDKASSYMFNGIIGAPFGGTTTGWRPYFSGGVGWIHANIQSDELLFDESDNKFAYDLGGGVLSYFHNWGIRGDVRYYQTLGGSDTNNALGLDLGDFNYWRATAGVVFRW